MPIQDTILARKWRDGDQDAGAEAMSHYANTLAALAYGVSGDASLAEDVVQETYVRAAKSVRRLKDPARLGAFLAGIARNVAREFNRNKRRERPLEALTCAAQPNQTAPNTTELERRRIVRETVARLPEDQREIFMLKYAGNLSYRDIAKMLTLSESAVSQKLWRVRQKLQEQLKEFRP